MDKISKFLSKLSKQELDIILRILLDIKILKLDNLDIKKMSGKEELYRVRKGNIRIIFKKENNKGIIINIDYRSNIYKK